MQSSGYCETFGKFDLFFFQLLEALTPCLIASPLDCFWEGSKVLGPHTPLQLPTEYVTPTPPVVYPVQNSFSTLHLELTIPLLIIHRCRFALPTSFLSLCELSSL